MPSKNEKLPPPMIDTKQRSQLVLGTAMWGWNVDTKEAFRLLDTFYEKGFRKVDAATNYPINKNAADFRRSEQILEAWILANGIKDLEIMIKVGSLNNLHSPEHNLRPSFLQLNWQYYSGHFGSNLAAFMIHWDNRDDLKAIQDSFSVLKRIHQSGLEVGASGILFPELYAKANEAFQLPLLIQLKHNLLHTDLPRYPMLKDRASFYSYGINAGGMKLSADNYSANSTLKARGGQVTAPPAILQDLVPAIEAFNQKKITPPILKMNEVAMCFALLNTHLSGVLIGPSRMEQLVDSLRFYDQVQQYDYSLFFQNLLKIHQSHAPADRSL